MARASVAGRSRVKRWRWVLVGAGAALFVLVLSRVIWRYVVQRLPHSDFEVQAAAFGDIAGAVFSAFAFAGLIVTALIQREELSLQREELRRSTEAQESSAEALGAQVETARQAAALNALSSLLDSHTQEFAGYGGSSYDQPAKTAALQKVREFRTKVEAQRVAMGIAEEDER